MSTRAQGQFTITDLNDATTLTGYIGSNLAKTQMYNPDNDTYTPDWSKTNLVMTPSLYVAGTSEDKITSTDVQSVTWYEGSSSSAITNGGAYALSGSKKHILTISQNILAGLPGKDFRCEIAYRDPVTGLDTKHIMTITFSRVVNGSGITDLLITTPDGNIFKNSEVNNLTINAELWRGSAVDSTNVTYEWYVMDPDATDEGAGAGWKKLSNDPGKYTGTATNILTVYAAAVDSYAVFKCVATDTDSASATYNQKFIDSAALVDQSDPLQVIIQSTGGNVFKNGEGSTVLTAKCYRAGSEVDSGGSGSYTWTKYNKDGEVDTSWGTSGSKTGKTLSIGSADVDVKATFICEVTL